MKRPSWNILNPVVRVRAKVLSRSRLIVVLFAVFLCGSAASAQTNIYQLRGDANYGIYVYNVPANTNTLVYQPYPVLPAGNNSATLAQRPSDGMLFYVAYLANAGNNPRLFQFNPATPNVAPVPVGSGLGATVPSSLRMAFSSGGTLYYLPDTRLLYTINTATGIANSTGVTIGTSAQITSGGDMAFSAADTLYISTSSKTIFTASIATGTATRLGNAPVNFTPSANATIGLAFNSSGELLAQTQSPNNIYRIPLGVANNATPQGILVRSGDGDTTATGDMASNNVPQPNLSITKTDNLASVYRGGPVRYIITVTNNGTYPVTGTVVDNVPATVTGITWTCAATLPSFCGAASGSGNSINTTATLSPGASATYTFTAGTLSAAAAGTLVNTATVAVPGWLADSNPADNTATDSDTIELNANLAITKTDGVANITAGNVVTYTIVVSNAGPDASNGSIVTDNVPAAVTTVTWTCGTPTGGATCGAASGSGNAISTTANLPSGSTLRYTVTGTLSVGASGTLANTARIITPAGVSDPTDLGRTGAGNNSATDTDTITAIPNVVPQKSVSPSGPSQPPGTELVYTITFTNVGGAAAQNLVITDPFSTATDFKLASESHVAPVTVNVAYWDTRPPTPQWVVSPTSDGTAPAGYARNITKIRWTFAANLAPGASATLTFSVRIP